MDSVDCLWLFENASPLCTLFIATASLTSWFLVSCTKPERILNRPKVIKQHEQVSPVSPANKKVVAHHSNENPTCKANFNLSKVDTYNLRSNEKLETKPIVANNNKTVDPSKVTKDTCLDSMPPIKLKKETSLPVDRTQSESLQSAAPDTKNSTVVVVVKPGKSTEDKTQESKKKSDDQEKQTTATKDKTTHDDGQKHTDKTQSKRESKIVIKPNSNEPTQKEQDKKSSKEKSSVRKRASSNHSANKNDPFDKTQSEEHSQRGSKKEKTKPSVLLESPRSAASRNNKQTMDKDMRKKLKDRVGDKSKYNETTKTTEDKKEVKEEKSVRSKKSKANKKDEKRSRRSKKSKADGGKSQLLAAPRSYTSKEEKSDRQKKKDESKKSPSKDSKRKKHSSSRAQEKSDKLKKEKKASLKEKKASHKEMKSEISERSKYANQIISSPKVHHREKTSQSVKESAKLKKPTNRLLHAPKTFD